MGNNQNPNWGGARPNAGRKKLERKARCLRLTDEEYDAVKLFIKYIRKQEEQ